MSKKQDANCKVYTATIEDGIFTWRLVEVLSKTPVLDTASNALLQSVPYIYTTNNSYLSRLLCIQERRHHRTARMGGTYLTQTTST